ncbi:MAG: hypothetical protein HYR73_04920 [Candidatus Eisenbacteria bacterium]|nr:hypothetical protein [Candidatus Eisenbacteria bacterium]
MSAARSRRALPALLFALGLFALYLGALRTGFLNDYYLFLEQARRADLPGSLIRLDALGNYWRPLSRQIYFAALTPLSHGAPGLFHAVNFALFLAALALLADLLFAVAAPVGAIAGLLYFATLPFQRVAMLWISCSQDLVALAFGLAALALYRRARFAGATCLLLGAFAGKEAALPLPLAFAGWDFWIARRPIRESLRRAAPFAGLALAWGIVSVAISLRGAGARWLHFDPASFAAAYLHEAQSLIGLDHPAGFLAGLAERGPNLAALLPLSAIAWFVPPESAAFARVPHRAVAAFAITWLLALGVVVGPVAAEWSSYYFMLSAVGASVLVALATRNLGRWGWPALVGALLWWHAGSTGSPAFAVEENRWGWTSHLTSYYFERAAAITDTLSRQLRSLDPTPPRGARLFFATLPPWAGFQMGNGALVRHLYRDPSIESWFYSQYSESTAADRPCRFFWWDGRALQPLYRGLRDPSFQVGADLLLLDRPAGAAHAFRRGLVAGGDRADLLYWL